jgi:lipoprotein-releasing system ATP-binding protein
MIKTASLSAAPTSRDREDETISPGAGDCASLLVVSHLRKSYSSPDGERREVLADVSFSATRGELVAITGPSGSGKTTLLNLIGGLDLPDSGEVIWPRRLDKDRAGAGTPGFVFQYHYLLADLTAVENVALPLMIDRLDRHESMQRADRTLRDLGLGERAHERVTKLSGGERQRVALARALITRPALILADEPTGSVERALGDEIGELLTAYCRSEQAVVVVATHNDRLAAICDRRFSLVDGRLRAG